MASIYLGFPTGHRRASVSVGRQIWDSGADIIWAHVYPWSWSWNILMQITMNPGSVVQRQPPPPEGGITGQLLLSAPLFRVLIRVAPITARQQHLSDK